MSSQWSMMLNHTEKWAMGLEKMIANRITPQKSCIRTALRTLKIEQNTKNPSLRNGWREHIHWPISTPKDTQHH